MKHYLTSFAFLLLAKLLMSQGAAPVIKPENTYAIVIGIANYENDRINLNYANKDAEVFARYLLSSAGGAVPEDNIRLLIDTNATTAAIYNALKWVKKKTELNKIQDDKSKSLIYFYFSGHGDVETNTKANLGFLLAYNTPSNNYLNNAVRIEDLNDYAHTLSVDLNANVVIITDACHSGKLAGNINKGTYLIGKELSMARDREVRIASCNPDELSMEDVRWGNGRGVFSWYLVNGLYGMADNNKDKSITLEEVKGFINSSITNDPVLKEYKHKQTPVLAGNGKFKLASVNSNVMLTAMSPAPVVQMAQPANITFWKEIDNNAAIDSTLFSNSLMNQTRNAIPDLFIQNIGANAYTPSFKETAMAILDLLQKDSVAKKIFTDKLIEWLHAKGQGVINEYLAGDEAELEKRRYYTESQDDYELYAQMLALAIKLVDKDDPLYRILTVNQLYLSGVANRVKMPRVPLPAQKILLEKALQLQLKAFALSAEAPYVLNELGIIYKEKKEYTNAEKYFVTAAMHAPSWCIPPANLCGLYAELKKFDKAKERGEEAEQLQPGTYTTQNNIAAMYELSGNLLLAEEYYRNAIALNTRHFYPFERLAYVYLKTTKYALADSFFHEAAMRKKGFYFQKNNYSFVAATIPFVDDYNSFCKGDTSSLEKDDMLGFFYIGMLAYQDSNYLYAEKMFKKVIALDKQNPLVFHYMGKIMYEHQNWERAEVFFKFAVDYYQDEENLQKYIDSIVANKTYRYDHSCFENFFLAHRYDQLEDPYFLATAYEKWQHYDEAETWYRKITVMKPKDIGGYVKLWRMMENQNRLADAEKIVQSFAVHEKERTTLELNSFYRRCIEKLPDDGNWPLRLGLLLYERAITNPSTRNYLDTIIWFPSVNKEVFMGLEERKMLANKLRWDINVSGSPQKITLGPLDVTIAQTVLPGVKELISLAPSILTPRKEAVYYLKLADSLATDEAVKADLNFKLGNVLVWSGSNRQAYPHYIKSVELEPRNANARLNLANVCKAIYKHQTGMQQLTYLYDSTQINFEKRLWYGEWCIHAGQFTKARQLISEAQAIHPYTIATTYDLLGRLNLFTKQYSTAISFYKQYFATNAKDAAVQYSLARLYALSGNKTEAWKWLGQSFQNGFALSYILEEDEVWRGYRNTPQWNKLLKNVTFITYPEPKL
jgi:Flp pilus assembly protein TadD